jgi:ketosteroid isomerase-like protein
MSTTTTVTGALTVHRAMFAAVRRGDMAALRALYAPDYTYIAADGIPRAGADAGIEVAELYTTAFPDVSLTEEMAHAPAPDVSVMVLRVRGTHTGPLGDVPPTGRTVTGLFCNIVEVRDGLIVRELDFIDRLTLLEQLGLG